MKELEQLTGTRKSTILFYIREGLLPVPEKTAQNSAVYDESYIDMIKKIRELQQLHNLPLRSIREMLKGGWGPIEEKLAGKRVFFEDFLASQKYTFDELIEVTGVGEQTLRKLIDLELIVPLDDSTFDEEDRSMLVTFTNCHISHGLPLEKLAYYPGTFGELAEKEMAYRDDVVKGLPKQERLEISVALQNAAYQIHYYQGKRMLQKLIRERLEV